jgi:diguanylate cyclase (GGDEF)-like protein
MMSLLIGYQMYASAPQVFQVVALLSVMCLTGVLLVVPNNLLHRQEAIVWLTTLNTVTLLLSATVGRTFETATALGLVIILSMVSYSRSRAELMVLGGFICVAYATVLHQMGLWDAAHLLVIPILGALLLTYGCRNERAPTSRWTSAPAGGIPPDEARTDMLTGLPNRHEFLDRVNRIIRYTRMNPNFHFAIAFLDLDDFKPINDRFGHKAGDLVLQRIAQRLKSRMKTGDAVARYGGDEFVLLIVNVHSEADVIRVVERVLTAVQEPIDVGVPVQVGASIGITLSTSVHASAEDLIKDADAAMYRAKAQGKNRYAFSKHIHDTAPTEFKDRLRQLLHSWAE